MLVHPCTSSISKERNLCFLILENNFNVITMNTFYIWIPLCYTNEYILYMNPFVFYWWIHFIYEYLYVILMNTFYIWIPLCYTDEYILYMNIFMFYWWMHFIYEYLCVILMNTLYIWLLLCCDDEYILFTGVQLFRFNV